MNAPLGRFAEPVYALFRIVLGAMFAMHGAQKLLGMFGGAQGGTPAFPSQMWFGGVIELVGGLLILIGLVAGCAGFVCSGQMAVAYFQFHSNKDAVLPIQNHGEAAVLYCFAFLLIASKGSGVWSVDALRRKG